MAAQTGLPVTYSRPVDYSRVATTVTTLVAILIAAFIFWGTVKRFLLSRWLWALVSLVGLALYARLLPTDSSPLTSIVPPSCTSTGLHPPHDFWVHVEPDPASALHAGVARWSAAVHCSRLLEPIWRRDAHHLAHL